MILDRINDLLFSAKLPILLTDRNKGTLHDALNTLDSAVGADTEWLSSLECNCLWHVGKMCERRRAVGARVRMLEEAVALNLVKRKFA